MVTEIERIYKRPNDSEKPNGLGTTCFIALCEGNSKEVLATAKSTLRNALILCQNDDFNVESWKSLLPQVFLNNSIPHPTPEEIKKQLAQPLEKRIEAEHNSKWSLEMFMNSFSPELAMRYWKWWDVDVLDKSHLVITVEVTEWPFPCQSLRWLFCGSGAVDVIAKE